VENGVGGFGAGSLSFQRQEDTLCFERVGVAKRLRYSDTGFGDKESHDVQELVSNYDVMAPIASGLDVCPGPGTSLACQKDELYPLLLYLPLHRCCIATLAPLGQETQDW
jgi:hypothetical protein